MFDGIDPLAGRSGTLEPFILTPLGPSSALDGAGRGHVGIASAATSGGVLDLSCQPTPTELGDTLQQDAIPPPVLPSAVTAAQASPTTSPINENPPFVHNFPRRIAGVDPLEPLSDISSSPALSLIPKASRNLRLPSFDLLGIAAPHSDHIDRSRSFDVSSPFCSVGAGTSHPLHVQSPSHSSSGPEETECSRDILPQREPEILIPCKAVKQYIATVTPPDDLGVMDWGVTSDVPESDPVSTAQPAEQPQSPGGRPTNIPIPSNIATGEQTATIVQPIGLSNPGVPVGETHGWLEDVLSIIATDDGDDDDYNNTVQMLSHALPCPSPAGHAFPLIVRALQDATSNRLTFINVFHAVPGRFNIADLPTSPPSTPGPAVGGDDYFAVTTYDSAVHVSDYQAESTLIPAGPQPVVAPGTMNISVVERYIPPTNRNEVHGLFRPGGPSILMDRLAELGIGGHLVFVYPTRAGGRTFTTSYLGPLLDPILRFMNVVNGLSSSVCENLGRMVAVDVLSTYDDMVQNVQALCRRLNRPQSGVSSGEGSRLHSGRRRAHFDILHARKETVILQRKVWAQDWWVKQEKNRIRDAVARAKPNDRVPSYLQTVQEIMDGVAVKGRYPEDEEPTDIGIEVGVFVIKKSLETSQYSAR